MIKPILVLSCLFLLSASCSMNGEISFDYREDNHRFVFSAQSEYSTKTILTDDGQIRWMPGDAIHVYLGSSDWGKFVSNIVVSSLSAEFVGDATSHYGTDDYFWATYPYTTDNDCTGKSLIISVPDEQYAVEGSFDKSSFVSVARSKTTDLTFYNVCGGIKFSVSKTGITRIRIGK